MSEAYWERGWCTVEGLLDPSQLRFLRAGMEASRRQGRMRLADNPAYTGPFNEYGPPAGEAVLRHLAPRVAALLGRALVPTYAFWRIYRAGDVLRRHRDRESCEVTLSITVAADPEGDCWPIHVIDLAGEQGTAVLAPGSGVLYQGCRLPHWREPLAGGEHFQLIVHYVLADGPNASFAYDRRV